MSLSVTPGNSTNVRSYARTAALAPAEATLRRQERDPALTAWATAVVAGLDVALAGSATAGKPEEPPSWGVAGAAPPPHEKTASTKGAPPAAVPSAPWWMRAGFAVAGVVAPNLAAAWAERLFCTAPRHPTPPAEAATLAEARAGFVEVDGRRLATWTWGEGPAVLLVHGWGGRGGQLHVFVAGLLAAGHAVVTFDGPGHGRSEGRLSSLVEHGRAVRAVAASIPGLRAVIAHSMGGPATAFALEEGLGAEAVVFVAPPFAAGDWVAPFSDAVGLSDDVRERMVRRVEARLGVEMDSLTMARTAPRMTAPLLVIHDRADKEVPFSAGAGIASRWPGARLHATEGLGHKRILGDADVIARAVAFVTG